MVSHLLVVEPAEQETTTTAVVTAEVEQDGLPVETAAAAADIQAEQPVVLSHIPAVAAVGPLMREPIRLTPQVSKPEMVV
jgi:hypothetical protein